MINTKRSYVLREFRESKYVLHMTPHVRHMIRAELGLLEIRMSPAVCWTIKSVERKGREKFLLELWDDRVPRKFVGYFDETKEVPISQGLVPLSDGYIILPKYKEKYSSFAGTPAWYTEQEWVMIQRLGLNAVYRPIRYTWKVYEYDTEDGVTHSEVMCVTDKGKLITLTRDKTGIINVPGDAIVVVSDYLNDNKVTGVRKEGTNAYVKDIQHLVDYEDVVNGWLLKNRVSTNNWRRKRK